MDKQRGWHAGLLVNTDVPTVAFGLYHISAVLKAAGIPCFIRKFQDMERLFSDIQGLGSCGGFFSPLAFTVDSKPQNRRTGNNGISRHQNCFGG